MNFLNSAPSKANSMPLMRYISTFAILSLVSVASLTGCTMGSFPEASANPTLTPLGIISGNNYGGHAPLVGAHIYVVEPGKSGYGSVVKSLLTAGSGTIQNGSWTNSGNGSDEFVPATDASGNAFYGIQADLTGSFNISGDYTCDAGSPVFLIGYGGTPQFPSGTNTFAISKVVVTGTANPYTYTFTVSAPPENAYVGEAVTVTGTIGSTLTPTGTGVIAGTATNGLSTSQFSITSTTGTAGTYSPTGVTATFAPTFNPGAVNMAMLGVCPSTGTFQDTIHYVYMNEVSTAATAYSLAGFVNSAATAQTGNDEFHIGSSGTTQAIQGTTNAALTAANLYDIEGSQLSTQYAGEGHIANSKTAGGNGTVPQTTLDGIGNILAACVDSPNTYRIVTEGTGTTADTFTGTASTSCTALFQYASDNGVYDTTVYNSTLVTGHQAFNTAQAAFSMANFPQGEGTGTTTAGGVQTVAALTAAKATAFATGLFNIPTGNVPFAPYLTTVPNSWAVPIVYTAGAMLTPYRDAIDSQGNIWVIGNGQTYALKFNNLGVLQYTLAGVDSGVSVAIDQNDNAWVTSTSNNTVQEFSSTGTVLQSGLAPTGINAPYAVAVDGSNNVWVGNESSTNIIKMTNAGALTSSFADTDADEVEGMAFDNTGAVWIPNVGNDSVQKIPNANNAITYNKTGNGLTSSARAVVDAGNNAWFEDITNNDITKISSAGAFLSPAAGFTVAGGNGTNPEGLGVDGAGNIWVGYAGTTSATSSLAEFNNAGVYIANFAFAGQNGTRGAQIDSSGNVWVVENAATPATLIEFVGAATPVVTPTSIGVKNSTLGTKP
jgi:hypothetical protein